MAEDFDDFGDFASAFPTTGGVSDAKTAQTTSSSAINQTNSAEKVDFFASFPPPILSTSGDTTAPLNFTSFDAISNHTSQGGVMDRGEIANFSQFDVANMDFSELKIPSPTDPNIHMAGGVAFDIPPILDDDFSNPSSPTATAAPPSQVQFQADLFSADFTKVVANQNQEVKENDSDIHLSFPTSVSQQTSHQTQEGKGEAAKDDSFGEFESSSVSLKTNSSGLKTTAEPSNVEGSNLGLFPDNSTVPIADSNAREATNSGQVHSLGGDWKPSDGDFGEFGDFTQSTGIDKTETLGITNLGNSLDTVGFGNFESAESAKSESKQPDTSTADDPVPPPSSDALFAGFDHFQSSVPKEKVDNQDSTQQFGDFDTFSNASATTTQEAGFGAFQTLSGSSASAAQGESTQVANFGTFSTANDTQNNDFASAATSGQQGDAQFGDFGAFSSSSTTNAAKDNAEFGNFGGFQTSTADSTTTAQSDSQFGDFGAFSSSSTANTKEDDFGNFGAFQTETGSTAVVASSTSSTQQGNDFGTFADSTSKDDDFGDFSTSDSSFGNFASSEPAPKVVNNSTVLKVSTSLQYDNVFDVDV